MVDAKSLMRVPHTVPPTESVWSALPVMRDHDVRHLLVVDGDQLVGVLSNRDYRRILERLDPEGRIHGVSELRVRDIMTPAARVVTAKEATPLLELAYVLVSRKIGCLPIVDGAGRPVGILTQKDVIQGLISELRKTAR